MDGFWENNEKSEKGSDGGKQEQAMSPLLCGKILVIRGKRLKKGVRG